MIYSNFYTIKMIFFVVGGRTVTSRHDRAVANTANLGGQPTSAGGLIPNSSTMRASYRAGATLAPRRGFCFRARLPDAWRGEDVRDLFGVVDDLHAAPGGLGDLADRATVHPDPKADHDDLDRLGRGVFVTKSRQ